MSSRLASNPGSVSSLLVRRMQRLLALAGVSPREFCQRSGVQQDELDSDSARIGAQRYARVQQMMRDARQAGLPFERSSMPALLEDFPQLASVWCNSPSLATALRHYGDYRALLGEFDRFSLHAEADGLEIRYQPETHPAGSAIGADSALGNFMLIAAIVDHYGDGLPLQATVGLGGMPPAELEGIEQCLGPRCRIDRHDGAHRMLLRGPALWRPAEGFNPLLYEHSCRRLARELQDLHRLPPLASRVCAAIDALWSQGPPEPGGPAGLLSRVADQLGMSRWTLRRHLEAEGQGFAQLLDELRLRSVGALLADPKLSMLDISQRLGFDSQSSFSRFFRQQFEQTPAKARARLRARGLPPGISA